MNPKELFEYQNGKLFWKVNISRRVRAGQEAGTLRKNDGYTKISYRGKHYLRHRLIFWMFNGYEPTEIDHINRNRSDDRIENLREVTRSQNCMNRTGVKGYYFNKERQKYKAIIKVNGVAKHLGYFDTEDEAYTAYQNASAIYHREYSSTKGNQDGS